MPSAKDIVDGLTLIANRFVLVSLGWHALLAFALAAIVAGWHPTRRAAAGLIVAPLGSVAVLAVAGGNPFNAVIFFATALAMLAIALRFGREPIARSRGWFEWVGLTLLVFGWVYPHFLIDAAAFEYLYAAPMGAVPCPTLSAIVGLSLLANGFGSRAWCWVLGAVSLFYGIFGALQLGVRIDFVLVLGSVALTALPMRLRRNSAQRA